MKITRIAREIQAKGFGFAGIGFALGLTRRTAIIMAAQQMFFDSLINLQGAWTGDTQNGEPPSQFIPQNGRNWIN